MKRALPVVLCIVLSSSLGVGASSAPPSQTSQDGSRGGPDVVPLSADTERQLLESNLEPTQQMLNKLAAKIEKNPRDVSARCLMGLCYERLGFDELAEEQFSIAVQCAPNDPQLWIVMVKQHLKSGHTDLALRMIQAAHERFSADPEVLFWYGNYYSATAKIDQADYAYQLALKENKEVEGLRSALGEVCLDKGRYGDALSLAKEEIKRHPRFWLAYKVKGLALIGLNKRTEAVPSLKVAFENMPGRPQIAYAYAQTCTWSGLWKDALKPALMYLDMTSRLTSNDAAAKKLVASTISAMLASEVRNELPIVSNEVSTQKPNAAYHFALGDILDRLNFRDLAIDQYLAGLKMEPHFARGIYRLGNDYEIFLRDYPTALSLYTSAHALAPEDREIAEHFFRLNFRYMKRYNDLAWRLKDWLQPSSPSQVTHEK